MKKTMKRGFSLLFVMVMLASMLAMPASAKKKDDWYFEFRYPYSDASEFSGKGNPVTCLTLKDAACRRGTWRTVYFKLKGTGIKGVNYIIHSNNRLFPIKVRNLLVSWRNAGQWCCGSMQVRGTLGSTGSVDIFLEGSYYRQICVIIA